MFTIKLYYIETTAIEPKILKQTDIRESARVVVHDLTAGIYEVEADSERYRIGQGEKYYRAIIENAAGKTTEIIGTR